MKKLLEWTAVIELQRSKAEGICSELLNPLPPALKLREQATGYF
jgi:hypothetical protein